MYEKHQAREEWGIQHPTTITAINLSLTAVIWTTVHEFTKAVVLVCGRMRAVCLRTLMHVIKIDVSQPSSGLPPVLLYC